MPIKNGAVENILYVISAIIISTTTGYKQPNIIFILADDMGWNDVSYNGMNEIWTPNIDTLGADGLVLNHYYTQAICTPSRFALMTSLYPMRYGFQSLPSFDGQLSAGVPLNLTLLPQRLKNLGYTTRAVGKWHLGYQTRNYTPTYRGFDSHFGYWGGVVDYYQYTVNAAVTKKNTVNAPPSLANQTLTFIGYNLFDNLTPVEGLAGTHLTDLLTRKAVEVIHNHDKKKPLFLYFSQISVHAPPETQPLRAPKKYTRMFPYITDTLRKNFAGELTALDKSVGDVMEALYNAQMLDNTIVIFSSDNGGGNTIFGNGGSNYPLRGTKISCFEGGNRVPGLVWSPLLRGRKGVSNDLMHITDWLPTFYRAAGGDVKDLGKIDGYDQWDTIFNGQPTNRKEMLMNIDQNFNTSGIRIGDYKLIWGRNQVLNIENWFGPSGRVPFDPPVQLRNKVREVLQKFYGRRRRLDLSNKVKPVDCGGPHPQYDTTSCIAQPCLYNMVDDPCEYVDISQQYPEKTQELMTRLREYMQFAVKPHPRTIDYNANPLRFCGLWTTWLDPDSQNMDCCNY